MGSPRCLDTSDYLFREFVVLKRAARVGGETKDRLLVRRALLEANAPGDDRPEDLGAEHFLDMVSDIPAEDGALVMDGYHHTEEFEVRVRASLDFLNCL